MLFFNTNTAVIPLFVKNGFILDLEMHGQDNYGAQSNNNTELSWFTSGHKREKKWKIFKSVLFK